MERKKRDNKMKVNVKRKVSSDRIYPSELPLILKCKELSTIALVSNVFDKDEISAHYLISAARLTWIHPAEDLNRRFERTECEITIIQE